MRKRVLLAVWVALSVWFASVPARAADSPRLDGLEKMLERAVDLFQMGRPVEAKAVLNRLIAEDPTNDEAYALRRLFGHRVLLDMQSYSVRSHLTQEERDILTALTVAGIALHDRKIGEAIGKMDEIAAIGKKRIPDYDPMETVRANEIKRMLQGLQGQDFDSTAGRGALRQVRERVDRWREELQSLGNAPLLLLARAEQFEQDQLRSEERIREIVAKAVRDPEGNQRHLMDVSRLGAYAVPELLEYLQNDREDWPRTNAAVILTALGSQVVVPLAEALHTDNPMLQQQIIEIFNRIRPLDLRAVPAMKRIYDSPETVEPVRRVAAHALRSITGMPVTELPAAQNFYYAEANRYYLGGRLVEEQMEEMNNTFWVWDPEGGREGKGGLRELRVPAFALDDLMAEEMAYTGMALAQDQTPFQVLLASIFLQQKREIEMLEKVVALQDLTLPLIDQLKIDVKTWSDRLYKNLRIAYTLGPQHLITVVNKGMRDGKPEVVIGALEALSVIGREGTGWDFVSRYVPETGVPMPERPTLYREDRVPGVPTRTKLDIELGKKAVADGEITFREGAGKTGGNPVLQALYHPNHRVRIAAANCLVRIGIPATHPVYVDLLPVLMQGAEENKVLVGLVISADPEVRHRVAGDLERKNVLAMTAVGGLDGVAAAVTYPPKDVIFLDGDIHEFVRLRDRLELHQIEEGGLVPLTIITSRAYVSGLVAQFTPRKIEDIARDREMSVAELLDESNQSIDDMSWIVEVRHDANPNDLERIFEELRGIKRYAQSRRPVVILTNESTAERERLKDGLKLRAERSMRPSPLDQLAQMRRRDKVLGDNWGASQTFVPVFLDSDVGGMNVMKTVQALYTDPRTRPVPVVILSTPRRMEELTTDFQDFIQEGHVQVTDRTIRREQVFELAQAMSERNPLSQNHYARAVSNAVATESARGLKLLDRRRAKLDLSRDNVEALVRVVEDRVRPVALRIAAAEAIGHFDAGIALGRLQEVFRSEDKAHVALRVAVLDAIGQIDRANKEMEFMSAALSESDIEIQRVAGVHLGLNAQNNPQRREVVSTHRPNNPLSMVRGEEVDRPARRVEEEGEVVDFGGPARAPIQPEPVFEDDDPFGDDDPFDAGW